MPLRLHRLLLPLLSLPPSVVYQTHMHMHLHMHLWRLTRRSTRQELSW